MYQKIKGPGGLQLVLDSSQVFPDDPGNGTPVIVEKLTGRNKVVASSTYNCALGEGVLEGHYGGHDYTLTDEQIDWLHSQDAVVDAVYEVGNASKNL